MRQRLFEIVEHSKEGSLASKIYDLLMLVTIVVSIVPLAFRETNTTFLYFDAVSVSIFIADYLLRWITADYKLQKGWKSFLIYPFTLFAIIDLFSICRRLACASQHSNC